MQRSLLRRTSDALTHNPVFHALSDLMRLIKAPDKQMATWRDYADTRRRAAFLRQHNWSTTPGKTALVYCRSSWVYGIKLYAMLGLGLRLQGWRILWVISSRRDRWAPRFLRAFGFKDFVYWSDLNLSDAEKAECKADAEAFKAHADSFQAVKDWEYRGCWIGPQMLSSISRKTHEGSPDPADPETSRQLLKLLPDTLELARLAEKLIDQTQPDLIYLTEPNYAHNSPITDVAVQRGINFIQVAQVARDDALMLRRLNKRTRRGHPSSVDDERFAEIAETPWSALHEAAIQEEFGFRYGGKWFLQQRNQGDVQEFSESELVEHLGLDPDKKTACLFSHVLWDANLFYGEDLFDNNGEWFIESVRAACANPQVNWLIKLHPANVWKLEREGIAQEAAEFQMIRDEIGELPPHVKLLAPDCGINNTSLYKLIDYAVTIRGTVSTELPCFGIPVFTAGTGRAYGKGFTIDSHSREEYLDRLAHIQDQQPLDQAAMERAKHHALIIFRRRPWVMKTFQASFFRDDKGGQQALDHNLTLVAKSVAEIEANGDLKAFADWAGKVDEVDYLAPESDALSNVQR